MYRERRLWRLTARRWLPGALVVLALTLVCAAATVLFLYGPTFACVWPATGPAQPGTSGRRVLSGGRERCTLLHVPPGYDSTQPLPLLISLHGFQSKPELHRFLTHWDDLADAHDFLVAYPQGSAFPLRWNANAHLNVEQVDDVQFISDLIAHMSEMAAVDTARVYVSGFSNGGQMAHRLACELADRVAAVGVVACWGADSTQGCAPSRPVPLIAFFGTADPQGDVGGGTSRVSPLVARVFNLKPGARAYASLAAWVGGWVERNRCETKAKALSSNGDVRGIAHTNCDGGAEVVLYTVVDGGHTWPGGPHLPFRGKTSSDIDASATMWAFFQRFTLSDVP